MKETMSLLYLWTSAMPILQSWCF